MSLTKLIGERGRAIDLAIKVLDRVHGDPDDDLAVLSRQFLRALEREQNLKSALSDIQSKLTEMFGDKK